MSDDSEVDVEIDVKKKARARELSVTARAVALTAIIGAVGYAFYGGVASSFRDHCVF